MSIQEAFKELKGVWPDKGEYLHVMQYGWLKYSYGVYGSFSFKMDDSWQYIGNRAEFEACRKEKWRTWNGKKVKGPVGKIEAILLKDKRIIMTHNKSRWNWVWMEFNSRNDIVAYRYE
jgi:hypothetical protein